MKYLLLVLFMCTSVTFVCADSVSVDTSQAPVVSQLSRSEQYRLDSLEMSQTNRLRELDIIHSRNIDPEGIIGVFIPIIALLGVCVIMWRNIESKRAARLAMIEKGMDPSVLEVSPNESSRKYGALRFGMLMAGGGLGLLFGFMVLMTFHVEAEYVPLILISSAALFGGAGLIAYHVVARHLEKQ